MYLTSAVPCTYVIITKGGGGGGGEAALGNNVSSRLAFIFPLTGSLFSKNSQPERTMLRYG